MTVAYKSMTKVVTTGTGTGALVHTAAAVGPAGEICLAPTIADDGKQFYIRIFTVNTQQIPNGDWEESLSTYTHSTKTWGRETFLRSSTGSPINFAAGTKHIALVTTEETLQSFVLNTGGTLTGEVLVRCTSPQLSLGPDNSHTYQVSVDASGNATLSATGNVTISPTLGGKLEIAHDSDPNLKLSLAAGQAMSIHTDVGDSLLLKDRSGVTFFRALRSPAWIDTTDTSFFQLSVGNGLFTHNAGAVLTRFAVTSLVTQITAGHYSTAPVPLGLFEVLDTDHSLRFRVSPNASGANAAAGNSVITPGVSTGNAIPASVVIQSTVAGSSGSTPQTLSDTVRITNGQVQIPGPHGLNAEVFCAVDPLNSDADSLFLVSPLSGFRIYLGRSGKSAVLNLSNVGGIESMPGFITANGLAISSDPGGRAVICSVDSIQVNLSSPLTSNFEFWSHTDYATIAGGTPTLKLAITKAGDIDLNTVAGTKIGTATGQKLGFWNATPVVQQVLATGAGHTVDNIISLLQTLGLCKQS
jgi:hypothetical protein